MDLYLLCSRYPPAVCQPLPYSFVYNACYVLTLIMVEKIKGGNDSLKFLYVWLVFFYWLIILSGQTFPSPANQESMRKLKSNDTHRMKT